MFIEIGSPCTLTLGLALAEPDGKPAVGLMGVTLQHPPTHLFVQSTPALDVSGARAHIAWRYAQQFIAYHGVEPSGEVEIELATYSHMGLGSDILLGLSTARGLAWLNQLPLDDTLALARALRLSPAHALQIWGFDQGGFLFVEAPSHADAVPGVVRRQVLNPGSRKEDWAFVFFFPRVPPGTPDSLEDDRLQALLNAARFTDESALLHTSAELWAALEDADFGAFCRNLMRLQDLNQEALKLAGTPTDLSAEEERVLDLMRTSGAQAWGRSPTGLCIYGLARGANASRELRKNLRAHQDASSGILMATIPSNEGARHVIRDGRIEDHHLPG